MRVCAQLRPGSRQLSPRRPTAPGTSATQPRGGVRGQGEGERPLNRCPHARHSTHGRELKHRSARGSHTAPGGERGPCECAESATRAATDSSVSYVVFFLCFLFLFLYYYYCYFYKRRGDSQKLTVKRKQRQREHPGLEVSKKNRTKQNTESVNLYRDSSLPCT